jgi:hypothetical protein
MTKRELKKLIKQVLNENQTDRESMVADIVDKIAAEIRSNPLYISPAKIKHSLGYLNIEIIGYLKKGYTVTFIIDTPNKIRVQLYDKNNNVISKQTFNKIEDVITAAKNPMSMSGGKANIPGLDGAQVVRTMKKDGKVFIQLSDGKTIWDAVLV